MKILKESRRRYRHDNNLADFMPEIFRMSDDDLIHTVQQLWKSSDPHEVGGIFDDGSVDQYKYWIARTLIKGRMNGKSDKEIEKEIFEMFKEDE